jgi:hypothetical protein
MLKKTYGFVLSFKLYADRLLKFALLFDFRETIAFSEEVKQSIPLLANR